MSKCVYIFLGHSVWTVFWNTLLQVRYFCRKLPPAQLLSCVPCCGVRTAAAAAWKPLCCVCPIVWDVHLSFFLQWSLVPHLSTFSRISASFVRIACVSTPQSVLTALVTKIRVLWDISRVDYWSSDQRRKLTRISSRRAVRLTSRTQKTQEPCNSHGDCT